MWYWIIRTGALIITKLLFGLKIEGKENIPKKNNFIVVANHSSFLDPLLVMVAIPQKIHCIASRLLYRIFWLRLFLKMTETIPSGNSSERALNLLRKNKVVGLFPEGGLTRDGRLREFRRGAALLAYRTGKPVVPCAIIGTYEALPFNAKVPKLFPVKVKIGKPIILLKEFEEMIDDIFLQEGIFRIKKTIKEMINAG